MVDALVEVRLVDEVILADEVTLDEEVIVADEVTLEEDVTLVDEVTLDEVVLVAGGDTAIQSATLIVFVFSTNFPVKVYMPPLDEAPSRSSIPCLDTKLPTNVVVLPNFVDPATNQKTLQGLAPLISLTAADGPVVKSDEIMNTHWLSPASVPSRVITPFSVAAPSKSYFPALRVFAPSSFALTAWPDPNIRASAYALTTSA